MVNAEWLMLMVKTFRVERLRCLEERLEVRNGK